MKVSLALSGGAARGAFHLGVIEAMHAMGVSIGAISGTSIGAVVAVGIGSGLTPRELLRIFTSKAFQEIFAFNYFRKGLFRIRQESAILQEIAPIRTLEAMKIPTFVTCVDLLSGRIIRFNEGPTHTLTIASAALIPLFSPIWHKNYLLIDGGFMDNLPIAPLHAYEYPIVSSDLFPLHVTQNSGFFSLYKRSLFLSFIASSQAQKAQSDFYITAPELRDFGLFTFRELDECFDLGYKSAMELIF